MIKNGKNWLKCSIAMNSIQLSTFLLFGLVYSFYLESFIGFVRIAIFILIIKLLEYILKKLKIGKYE